MATLFRAATANVQHDENGCREIVRQRSGKDLQCLHSACGGTHHDNILFWHPLSVSHLADFSLILVGASLSTM